MEVFVDNSIVLYVWYWKINYVLTLIEILEIKCYNLIICEGSIFYRV